MNFNNHFALLVGVNTYANPSYSPLHAVLEDINSTMSILVNKQFCGYNKQNVSALTGTEATRFNIINSFKKLSKETNLSSTIFIYFSGHGGRVIEGKSWQTYLCPTDTDPNKLDKTAISGDFFLNLLKKIPAKKMLVIIDACHAGGAEIKNHKTWKSGLPQDYYARLSKGEGRVLIASSKENQFSYIKGKNSLFTHYFIEALIGGANIRGDGYIHVLDVFDFVSTAVKEAEPKQEPILKAHNLDQNFAIALVSSQKTKASFATSTPINKIREAIINSPLQGSIMLSAYVTKHSSYLEKQNEIDLIRSELKSLHQECDLFGWDSNSKATLRKLTYRLLKICSSIG